MTAPPPRRPCWKRKRTSAAVGVALLVWYPLSAGPFYYLVGRGLPPTLKRQAWLNGLYDPVRSALLAPPLDRTRAFAWWAAMVDRCFRAGLDDAAAD